MTPEQREFLDDISRELDRNYIALDKTTKRNLVRFYARLFLNGNEPISEGAVEDYLGENGLL